MTEESARNTANVLIAAAAHGAATGAMTVRDAWNESGRSARGVAR